jgi:hypothetical protein
MPRIRSLFVSKEAFAFNGKTATLEWKERYAGVATRLGFAYDESCTDPSRLMYTPRIPDGAEIGEGKHEIIIIPGGELDLMNAERVANGSKRTSKGGAGRRSGAPTGERGEGDFETQGLKKFLAKYDKDFEAENFMEHFYPERFINKNGPKAHFRCPNEDSHSELKLNDTAFMVVNASEGESGFYMGCLHAGCIAASGKDRAWYLDLVCQDLKIAHAKELLEWCPNYQAKKTENEQAKALGADEKALKEAIGALSKDGGSADTEAVLRAIATISNEFWRGSAINDVKKKIGGSVPFLRETVKRYRKEQDEWEEQSEWGKQSDDEEDDDNGKPVVWVDRSYPEQVDALMQGLVDLNGSDPRIFSNLEGGIVKVSDDEKKTISREMTERRWHTYLGKTIIFKKHRQGSETTQSIAPTHDLVKHLLGLIDPPFPMLKKILRVPVFGPDGTLRWERGYDEAMEAYVAPDFVGREVPDVVSREHVDEALYHLKEVLWDFPFSDTFDGSDILSVKSNKLNDDGFPLPNYERGESSRAHAMAMLLQPFARNMIDGPCPAYHVDKPAPGTGAGYLVNAVFMIAEGEPAKVQSMSNSDEELRKRITALLREGTRIVFFDNINRKVVSPVLAAAVTATKWTDRVLGVSDTVTTDVEVAWIMAGNNLSFSREMMRRNVPIRLDAVVVDPSRDRGAKDFKHYPLQDWLSDERANLVWACHVLIKNWVQGGMVWGTKTMASFEAWAGVMGGILECAGVRGFLDNIKSYLKDKDEDEDVASQLVQLCYDKHGMMPMRVADILSATKGLYGEDLIELPIKGYDVKELVKNLGIYMNEIATRTFKINLTGTQTTEGAESQNATPDEQTQLVKLIKARKQNPAKWRLDPAPK